MSDPKPSIRYCHRGRHSIAWTAIGHGAPLVYCSMLNSAEQFVRSPLYALLGRAGRGRTVVLYDGVGSGLSDRECPAISIESATDDLECVVEAAGLDRFALIAGIVGAQAAIAYAARHPDKVERFVSIGGMARGLHHRNPSAAELARREALMAAIRAGRDDRSSVYWRVPLLDHYRGATDDEMRGLERWCDAVGDSETMIRLIEAHARADVSEDARRIRCPALVVHSRRDPRIPFDEGRRLAGIIPDAEFLPLDGEKTWPLPSDPSFGAAAEAIEHFLRAGEPARAPNGFAAELTPRERQVLELIARGLDNLQIAAHLGLSEKTVRNHITPIFSKLSVENRSQAIVRARDAGLGALGR